MEDSVGRFMALFSGYTKAYGTYNPQTLGMPGKQKPSYMKVDALPNSECFQHHLEGNQPIGIYLLYDDEMSAIASLAARTFMPFSKWQSTRDQLLVSYEKSALHLVTLMLKFSQNRKNAVEKDMVAS